MITFTAYRISANSNLLYPDVIKIDNDKVQYSKCAVIGYSDTIVPRQCIADVAMNAGLFFADVIITSYGGKQIIAHGFSKKDARHIVELLMP